LTIPYFLLGCTECAEEPQHRVKPIRRLARNYERLAQSLAGLHLVAFAILMTTRLTRLLAQGA